jgi:uncharacterized RDD family membrane protein YckC
MAAFVIDSAVPVIALVAAGAVVVGRLVDLGGGWTVGFVVLLVLCVGGTNGLVAWLAGGVTVGKAWAGLRVLHVNELPIHPVVRELPKVVARHTIGYLCIDFFLVGSLNALRDPRRRPLHDFVLGYEVVALADAPPSTSDRLRLFSEDLQAGQELVSERWGRIGVIVSKYIQVATYVGLGLVWLTEHLGLYTPSAHASPAASISAMPATTPTTVVAGGIIAGGTGVTAAALAASGALIPSGPPAYPDDLTLVPAVQQGQGAYPLGLPPDIHLEFEATAPATADELQDLAVVTAAVHSTATLTFVGDEWAGRSFELDDVIVPTQWRTSELESTEVRDWTNLQFTADANGFVPEGMAVADVEYEGDKTHGFKIASVGSLSLGFPYRGDGKGHIDDLGVELIWTGDMDCVVVDDPATDCKGKRDDVFWVWGLNNIVWQ